MNTPGLKLEEVFKRVRADVQEKSDNAQVPWDASSLTGDFFFVPPQEQLEHQVAKVALPKSSSSEAPKTIRADEEVWLDIKNSIDPEDFRFFLEEFPESSLAKSARYKLKRLERKQAKAGQQQQLADEAKRLEKERKQLEVEKKRLAETQRKVEEEHKRQQELAALRPKQEALSSGTVIDQATGLIWQKKPDGTKRNWEDAKSYCRNLQLGDYSDWELPNKYVLEDMLSKQDLFARFKRDWAYWSSTSNMNTSRAWIVGFHGGYVISHFKALSFYARCVRRVK
jgi:flagellar biosynthesis GTPase FlhF